MAQRGIARRTTVLNEAATLLIWRVTLLYNTTVDCIGHNRTTTPVRQKWSSPHLSNSMPRPTRFFSPFANLVANVSVVFARCNLYYAAPLLSSSVLDPVLTDTRNRWQNRGAAGSGNCFVAVFLRETLSFHFRVVFLLSVRISVLGIRSIPSFSREIHRENGDYVRG